MTLNASGPISLGGSTSGQSVNLELGKSATAQISFNDAAVRTLTGTSAGTALIMPTNFYGKSSITWTSRTQNLRYYSLSGGRVRYINETTPYLLIAGLTASPNYGKVAISYNATTWSTVDTTLGVQEIRDVAYSGSVLVLLSSGFLYSSSALTGTWTNRVNLTSGAFTCVIWAGSRFVAIGTDGTNGIVYTSTNGTSWTLSATLTASVSLIDVTYDGTTYVVVGVTTSGNYYVATSTDAVSWTSRTLSGYTSSQYPTWVVWTGSYFVVPDYVNGVWRSTTGSSWTYVSGSYALDYGVSPAVNGSNIYVPASYSSPDVYGVVYVSTDSGATWASTTTGSSTTMRAAGYGFSKYVAADDTAYVWTTP